MPSSNFVAIGFDEATVVIKIGNEIRFIFLFPIETNFEENKQFQQEFCNILYLKNKKILLIK